MLDKLVSNSWPQVIHLPQPAKGLGLQVWATTPGPYSGFLYERNNIVCGILWLAISPNTVFSRFIYVVAYISTSFFFFSSTLKFSDICTWCAGYTGKCVPWWFAAQIIPSCRYLFIYFYYTLSSGIIGMNHQAWTIYLFLSWSLTLVTQAEVQWHRSWLTAMFAS